MRLLVAEDERDLNRIIVSRLKAEHYSVDACYNGKEALEYRRTYFGHYDAGSGRIDRTKDPSPEENVPSGAAAHRQGQH